MEYEIEDNAIEIDYDQISGSIFSPDGHILIITHQDIVVYSHPDHRLLGHIDAKGERKSSSKNQGSTGSLIWSNAVFSPDSKYFYCGSTDGLIYCWDIASFACVGKVEAHEGQIWRLAISPNGRYIASTGEDNRLNFWQISSRTGDTA